MGWRSTERVFLLLVVSGALRNPTPLTVAESEYGEINQATRDVPELSIYTSLTKYRTNEGQKC